VGEAVTRLRVLIVDDHEQSRRVLITLFEKNGWEAVEAGTIEEALTLLEPVPDCAVLDLCLPDGGGETILRKIREEKLPVGIVAVVTGEDDPIRLGEVAELKPDLVVHKPIDWEIIWRYCDTQMRQSDAGESES
jgi:DNA-binding response OmpR family regulator